MYVPVWHNYTVLSVGVYTIFSDMLVHVAVLHYYTVMCWPIWLYYTSDMLLYVPVLHNYTVMCRSM